MLRHVCDGADEECQRLRDPKCWRVRGLSCVGDSTDCSPPGLCTGRHTCPPPGVFPTRESNLPSLTSPALVGKFLTSSHLEAWVLRVVAVPALRVVQAVDESPTDCSVRKASLSLHWWREWKHGTLVKISQNYRQRCMLSRNPSSVPDPEGQNKLKPRVWSRKVYCRVKQRRTDGSCSNPQLPDGLGRGSSQGQKLGVRAAGCLTFF